MTLNSSSSFLSMFMRFEVTLLFNTLVEPSLSYENIHHTFRSSYCNRVSTL
jgi:hypothetical protein